jgi:hypothetical protein
VLEWLDQAIDERSPTHLLSLTDPDLARFQHDARFAMVLRRVRAPSSHDSVTADACHRRDGLAA